MLKNTQSSEELLYSVLVSGWPTCSVWRLQNHLFSSFPEEAGMTISSLCSFLVKSHEMLQSVEAEGLGTNEN